MCSVAVGCQLRIDLYQPLRPSWHSLDGQLVGTDLDGQPVVVPNDGHMNANVFAAADRETVTRSVVMPCVMSMSESYVIFEEGDTVGRNTVEALECAGYITHFVDLVDDENSSIDPDDIWTARQQPMAIFVSGYTGNARKSEMLLQWTIPPFDLDLPLPVRIICDDLESARSYPDILWRYGRHAPRMTVCVPSFSELDHVRGCGRRFLSAFDTILLSRSNDLTTEERIRAELRLDYHDQIPFGREGWLQISADGTRRVIRQASLSDAPNVAWYVWHGMDVSELEPFVSWR